MRSQLFALCIVAVLTAACAPAAQVDIEAEQAALMERDKAWSQAASDADAEGMVSFLADDFVFLPDDGSRINDKEGMREEWENLFGLPGVALSWEATEAVVAKSGELGYTVGTTEFTVNGPDGNPVTTSGKYLTVWRKQSGGEWMVTADIFNNDAPPAAE